jgi:hypothetical protein
MFPCLHPSYHPLSHIEQTLPAQTGLRLHGELRSDPQEGSGVFGFGNDSKPRERLAPRLLSKAWQTCLDVKNRHQREITNVMETIT